MPDHNLSRTRPQSARADLSAKLPSAARLARQRRASTGRRRSPGLWVVQETCGRPGGAVRRPHHNKSTRRRNTLTRELQHGPTAPQPGVLRMFRRIAAPHPQPLSREERGGWVTRRCHDVRRRLSFGAGLPTPPWVRPQVSPASAWCRRPSVASVVRSGDRTTTRRTG